MKNLKTSELLLPVGNIEMCLAAIHNGADAIYVGMPGFNARGRSHDHAIEDLKEIIDTCHLYGVKVHVAFNILIFQDEIPKALERLREVVALGPDAFIVQDVGLIKLMKEHYPTLEVHGSTQMTVTCHDAIELFDDLGIKRFVLGRENSIEDIRIIRENTNKELEVFVHGALCVAYSGQCFTSEAIGGRSANRGQCAQSCRFEYELFVDGEKKQLLDKKYLVSPKDLCGIEHIDTLREMNINSFKVEGRLKSAEFVASVASSYRKKLDGKELDVKKTIDRMGVNFSRGFYTGWLNGVAHQELVDGRFGSHRGVLIGDFSIENDKIKLKKLVTLNPGDGILFAGIDRKNEVGSKIYSVKSVGDEYLITFSKDFNLKTIPENAKAYLNSSDKLTKELNKSFNDRNYFKKIPINVSIECKIGQKLKIKVTDGKNNIEVLGTTFIEKAVSSKISLDILKKTFGGLTHTVYSLEDLNFVGDENAFLPNKELKEIKRKFIEMLNIERVNIKKHEFVNINSFSPVFSEKRSMLKMSILIRSIEQLDAIVKISQQPNFLKHIDKVYLDYEFGKDFRPSIDILKQLKIKSVIATTRILKPKEYHNLNLIKRAMPDGVLVRNPGALKYLENSELELFGDFSLNISNSISANYFLAKGLKTIVPSYDLNSIQLSSLLKFVDTSKVEVTLHQYMPEFHMEHCVYAAFLSNGNSFKDCGKPCEKHKVELKDMFGNVHQIKADQECRNTMFRGQAQSAAKLFESLINEGVSCFRFEALYENAIELENKLQVYLKLMSGNLNSQDVYESIGATENYGVTTGQLFNEREYHAKKR